MANTPLLFGICIITLLYVVEGTFRAGTPSLQYVSGVAYSVLNHTTKGAENNKYGIEGGTVVKIGSDEYHLVTSEMVGDPPNVKMQIGHWSSRDKLTWSRVSTFYNSSGTFDGSDPRAALWGPMFYWEEDRWFLVYVGYRSAPNNSSGWFSNYDGEIWLAESTVVGVQGIGGPYRDIGIILNPGQESQSWEGLQGTDSFFIYKANGKYYGFYGSALSQYTDFNKMKWEVGLAESSSIKGPWTRLATNPVNLTPAGTCENPVVSNLPDGTYVAIFDYIKSENLGFGFTFSSDGVHWNLGQLITIPGGCRTPLALVPEGNDMYTLFYTRVDGYECLHVATLKLVYI